MTDTVPLATVALEVDEPLDTLAARLGSEVMYGVAAVRHIDARLAAKLIDAHRARQQAQREQEQAKREQAAALHAERAQASRADRDRVQAIARNQEALRAAGMLDDDTPALAVMAGADHQNKLEHAGRRFDELKNAANAGHLGYGATFTPTRHAEE